MSHAGLPSPPTDGSISFPVSGIIKALDEGENCCDNPLLFFCDLDAIQGGELRQSRNQKGTIEVVVGDWGDKLVRIEVIVIIFIEYVILAVVIIIVIIIRDT